MSSDFESYEQDFAVLTAEITGRIGKVPKLVGDEKKQMVANVEKQLEEARELLEQMELEVREIPPQSRGMYSSRMRSYAQEMGKLEADFKRSRIAYSDEVRNELLGDDGNSSENQLIKLREERAHLLDNTERLERSSRRLEAGYQIAVETALRGQSWFQKADDPYSTHSTTQVRSLCINGFSSVQFVDSWFFCYSLFMHKITFSALHNDRKFLNCKVMQM
uniref:Vesicle transport through interaction with t-SNAREs 1A n=1 Tax=Corvus moneduloides TaxID=1196302 RepID=A0A8C3DC95_CORMO